MAQKELRTVVKNQRKKDSSYTMSESLADLCPTIMWKAELVSNKVGYLVEISKQSIENVAWFLLAVYNKM